MLNLFCTQGTMGRRQDTALPLLDSDVANIQHQVFLRFKMVGHPDLEQFTRMLIEYKRSARLCWSIEASSWLWAQLVITQSRMCATGVGSKHSRMQILIAPLHSKWAKPSR